MSIQYWNVNLLIIINWQLIENLQAVYNSIEQNRPSGVKGRYFKSIYICSTMGPSIQLDLTTFS